MTKIIDVEIEPYFIAAVNPTNYEVHKRVKSKSKQGFDYERTKPISFHRSLGDALKSIYNLKVSAKMSDKKTVGLRLFINEMRQIQKAIEGSVEDKGSMYEFLANKQKQLESEIEKIKDILRNVS